MQFFLSNSVLVHQKLRLEWVLIFIIMTHKNKISITYEQVLRKIHTT